MKIMNLTENSNVYTSNVYLVLGTWNTIDDINTLIDVGSDPLVLKKIEEINTGLGKRKIDQVILTHSHSDHAANLSAVVQAFSPKVCAFNSHLSGIQKTLNDGDCLRIGENMFEVLHITAHSYDSICLFCENEGILFSGDTTFPIEFENEKLYKENEAVLSRLKNKQISIEYPGHGPPRNYSNKFFWPFKS
jgi:glyoxylase-like metal-dependent hydrolase (beta-lactamase superfamily II)